MHEAVKLLAMSTLANSQPSGTKIRMIADSLLASIASGQLRNGDRVPSERNLAREFSVSLGTVQRALEQLEHRGVLKREHGRGSFVRGLGASLDSRYVRFRDLSGKELPVFWHVVKHQKVKPKKEITSFFGEGVPLVRLDRQIDVNGQFAMFNHVFMAETSFGAVSDEVADNTNLREVLARRLSLPTLRIEELVGFAPMPAEVARALGCDPATLAFVLELRSYTVGDEPVYLQRIYAEPFHGAMLAMDTR